MRPRHLLLLSAAFLLFLQARPSAAAEGDSLATEEQTLKAAGLKADGADLLDFFRKRASADGRQEKIAEQIKKLADKEPAAQTKAVGELVCVGPVAIPLLRQAAKDPDDVETANRAKKCLENIEGAGGAGVASAAARVVAPPPPAGAPAG